MTKSKRQKLRNKRMRETKLIPMDDLKWEKSPTIEEYEHTELLRHCHKNLMQWPGNIGEGDYVCIMRVRPTKFRRKKYKGCLWKVKYYDSGNGLIHLTNYMKYDKEGAEENLSFFRSHNFPITDLWNLDSAFAEFLLPRLKLFIESTRYGIPGDIYQQYIDKGLSSEEADKAASEEWETILKDMYEGLNLSYNGPDEKSIRAQIRKDNPNASKGEIIHIEAEKEVRARELFSKHFFSLWD